MPQVVRRELTPVQTGLPPFLVGEIPGASFDLR